MTVTSATRPLSLHQLSMMELTPVELIRVAGEAGFEHADIFVRDMDPDSHMFPLVTSANVADVRAAMAATGVSIYNLEVFFLSPGIDVNDFRPALELGRSLGATRATAFDVDPDDSRATDNFARFCELTQELGIMAGMEFMAFIETKTLAHAMRIIRGANHPNGTLALDALHLMRNGTTPADLAGIGPAGIGYVQFCDGPETMAPDDHYYEAVHNRQAPGEGSFPLLDMLDYIAPDRCLSLEAPMDKRREAGMDALARARLLNQAARAVLRQHQARLDARS